MATAPRENKCGDREFKDETNIPLQGVYPSSTNSAISSLEPNLNPSILVTFEN